MVSNPVLLALSCSLLVAGLTVKPSSHPWIFFLPILILNGYLYVHAPENVEVVANSLILVTASEYLLLTDAQHELHKVGQKEPISSTSFWSRLKWSVQLLTTPRRIGWAHEPKSAIPSSNLQRGKFILFRLTRTLLYMLLVDVATFIAKINPSFKKTAPSSAEQSFLWHSSSILLFLAMSMPVLAIVMNLLPSIICVATGISEPNDWPYLFGKFGDAYTVRRFWR